MAEERSSSEADPEDEDDLLVGDPVDFWVSKQRELVTSTVDYNLGTLVDLITSEAINLGPRYQRRFRWDSQRQSRLIESFLMNAPVPPVYLNEDDYGAYSVIDGKQRLTAVVEFLSDRLPLSGLHIFSDINGDTFSTLPSRLQSILRTRPTLRSIIVLRQSDVDIKFEIFRRLNTGGVHLNAQEVRNSVYTGPLNDLILELSEHPLFHKLLGITSRQKSRIFKEMRDAEYVLRFFTFRDTWQDFKGGMARHMDEFMDQNRRPSKKRIDALRADFIQTIAAVGECFGEHAFRRWDPERGGWRNQVLAALFDAEMFACRGRLAIGPLPARTATIAGMQGLFQDSEFRRSVDAATNTPSFFKDRVRLTLEMLNSATQS